eukprot:44141-Rhodomonas_salina.1
MSSTEIAHAGTRTSSLKTVCLPHRQLVPTLCRVARALRCLVLTQHVSIFLPGDVVLKLCDFGGSGFKQVRECASRQACACCVRPGIH